MAGTRLPKPFTRAQVEALDRAAKPEVRAAMRFLRETGLRESEFIAISREEAESWPVPGRIFRRHPVVPIRVIGKGPGSMHNGGGKERVVLLSRAALLAARDLLPAAKNGSLCPWSDRGLRYVVAEVGKKAGVEGASPHRFRHTHATELAESGVRAEVIGEMLGHSSVNTSMLYILLSTRSKQDALARRRQWLRRR